MIAAPHLDARRVRVEVFRTFERTIQVVQDQRLVARRADKGHFTRRGSSICSWRRCAVAQPLNHARGHEHPKLAQRITYYQTDNDKNGYQPLSVFHSSPLMSKTIELVFCKVLGTSYTIYTCITCSFTTACSFTAVTPLRCSFRLASWQYRSAQSSSHVWSAAAGADALPSSLSATGDISLLHRTNGGPPPERAKRSRAARPHVDAQDALDQQLRQPGAPSRVPVGARWS